MSILKVGTRCVIIAGCPENIGLIVEVIQRLGPYGSRSDAYHVRTVSGRKFNQLRDGGDLLRSSSSECVTDHHKLRPLVDPKQGEDFRFIESPMPSEVVA